MNVERKTLRSISELSMFKYILVGYLIFFILFAIVVGIIFLIMWAFGFAAGGFNIQNAFGNLGMTLPVFAGGGALWVILLIVIGLVGSVFAAAVGAFGTWIINVIFRISGGIELRFIPKEKQYTPKKIEED
jgi:hypothetical protein